MEKEKKKSETTKQNKLKFALFKGMSQHYVKKYLGERISKILGKPYTSITDAVFRTLK